MSGDFHKNIEIVKKNLDRRTLLEGFAEEATELAQAALKLIRAEELNNNVTPVSVDEARDNLIEEIGDVHLYLTLLVLDDEKYEDIFPVMNKKVARWAKRLEAEDKCD